MAAFPAPLPGIAEFYPAGYDQFGQWAPGVWMKNGQPHRVGKHKKKYHFIWPKDGKNGSKWGRFKDILSGQGPDIHLTIGEKKMEYIQHAPTKSQWSMHTNLGSPDPDCRLRSPFPWINSSREDTGNRYDFYTRTFRKPDGKMWTDVQLPSAPGNWVTPWTVRDLYGWWW